MINVATPTFKLPHAMLCTSLTVLLAACGGGGGPDTAQTGDQTLASLNADHKSKDYPAPTVSPTTTTSPSTTTTSPTTSTTYHDSTWYPTLKKGPARTGEYFMKPGEILTGGSINCTGLNWCVHMADDSTLDGVEVFGTNTAVWGAAIEMNYASRARVINSYIHDVGGDGLMCNTDTSPGRADNLVQDNRFENTGTDAIHFKGTNADWRNGAWIQDSLRNKNHKIIGNVSIKSWRNGGSDHFSYELQDGQVDMIIKNNYADATYSLVGHIGSSQLGGSGRVQITGNYVRPSDARNWGFEVGNSRGVDVKGNTFDGSSASVVNTGNTDQKNANNTYGLDIFKNGASSTIHLNWDGGGNVANSPDVLGSPW